MIPKIIHLIWFGGNPYPPLVEKCINSWKQYLPDYEIMKWDESNFDIHCNKYVEQAYEAKKWAFVSDYVRLWALYNYGGIYLDTDVEIVKPLDFALTNKGFSAFEVKDCVAMGVIGFVPNHPILVELFEQYSNRTFLLDGGRYDTTTNVRLVTDYLIKRGLILNGKEQTVADMKIYPDKYFYANNLSIAGSSSIAIHHATASWTDNGFATKSMIKKIRSESVRILRNIIGTERVVFLRSYINKEKVKNGE